MSGISEQASTILENQMCIDTGHLVGKIESAEIVPYSDHIYQAIEELCGFVERNESAETVKRYFGTITETINESEEPYFVLDSLTMAFYRFISGGLRDLYTYQENEAWYPRIVLTKVLAPNDIDSLEEDFVIYRGCDRSELASCAFGQSWTTSRKVAKDFAFHHYSSQEWFSAEDRIILQALYRREKVLFSDQTQHGEFEVVVRTEAINDVQSAA